MKSERIQWDTKYCCILVYKWKMMSDAKYIQLICNYFDKAILVIAFFTQAKCLLFPASWLWKCDYFPTYIQ